MNLIIFILIFLIFTNWFQIISFLSVIVGPKYKISSVDDPWLKSLVRKKTGLTLLDITIFHDKKYYGMMAGLPFWPKMILSEGLYKNFSRNELEWVILHEAGHCVLWHNLQAFAIELTLLFLGIYSVIRFNLSFLPTILLAISASIICVQIIRWGIEYMADRYSINRVDDLSGVISAQKKFIAEHQKSILQSEKSILRFLLHWNIYPAKRIQMAKDRMKRMSL
jgi:Zn-dependent protease with chaperone function